MLLTNLATIFLFRQHFSKKIVICLKEYFLYFRVTKMYLIMKKLGFLVIIVFIAGIAFAQNSENDNYIKNQKDTVWVDTLPRNLLGLNVYPAFGMLGGGRLTSTKIFMQYKRLYDHMNLRSSINYLNFHYNNEKTDVLKIKRDTVIKNTDTTLVDSLVLRRFYYDVFSYDFRVGAEYAFPNKDWRFYFGGAIIAGIHNINEYYYHYTKEFKGYPVENVNFNFSTGEIAGYRKTSFFKTGVDLTIGVDINLSQNAVISVQYAPEIVYYHRLDQNLVDPDNFFVKDLPNTVKFIPDYIDIIVSIRF